MSSDGRAKDVKKSYAQDLVDIPIPAPIILNIEFQFEISPGLAIGAFPFVLTQNPSVAYHAENIFF